MSLTYRILILPLICLLIQGCGRTSPDIDKIILEHDPSFQETIDRRNSLRKEIELNRADFLKKDTAAEIKIKDLKKKRERFKRGYTQKEGNIKHELDPEKRQLERKLKDLERKYHRKNEEIQDAERDMKEINSLIKKQEVLSLTPEEIRTWNSRISVLVKKKDKISTEGDKLKKEIEITKLKIKVLEI